MQPEDSRAFSAGVVYTPKCVTGLTLSVDLWDIERKGVVTAPFAQEVVNRFNAGRLLPGEIVVLDPSGTSINAILIAFQNAGRQNARGVDYEIQYQLQTSFGTFTSLTQATYLDSFIFQGTIQSRGRKVSRFTSDPGTAGDGYLKWKESRPVGLGLETFRSGYDRALLWWIPGKALCYSNIAETTLCQSNVVF